MDNKEDFSKIIELSRSKNLESGSDFEQTYSVISESDLAESMAQGNKLSIPEIMCLFNMKQVDQNVTITKDIAVYLLDHNNDKNRNISNRRVKDLAAKINNGDFVDSNDSITFNREGTLTNGQHRLSALVQSNEDKIKVFVRLGINQFMGMDTGKSRSLLDNAKISDACDERLRDRPFCIKVGKEALDYVQGKYSAQNLSPEESLKAINYLADKLVECDDLGLFSGTKVLKRKTTVYAAIFIAYVSGVKPELLKNMCNILKSGTTVKDTDKPIIPLRDYLMQSKLSGWEGRREVCKMTETCIKRLERRSISNKKPSTKELGYFYKIEGIPYIKYTK